MSIEPTVTSDVKNSPERPSRSRAFPVGERPATCSSSAAAWSTSASDLGPSSAASAGSPTASSTSCGLSCSRNLPTSLSPALRAPCCPLGSSSPSRRTSWNSRSMRRSSSSRSASCFAAARRNSTKRWCTSRVSWPSARLASTPTPAFARSGRPPFAAGSRRSSSTTRATVAASISGGRSASRRASAAQVSPASRSSTPISASSAPWNTGVLASKPRIVAAQPRWVSRIWPTFIREEGHVLLRHDARDDALVAVATRHLVAHRDLALLGDVHLHQLDHARRELVRLQDLVNLVLGLLLDLGALGRGGVEHGVDPLVHWLVRHPQRLQVHVGEVDGVELGLGEFGALRQVFLHRAGLEHQPHLLPREQLRELDEHRLRDPGLLVRLEPAHLADALAAVLLDHLVLDAREDLHVDDHALHPRRHLEGRVLHVLGLLAEDGGEQLLLGGELGLALRGDLPDQDVAGLHVRADADDAALVQIDERLLGHVGDLARDLLAAALGVADVEL